MKKLILVLTMLLFSTTAMAAWTVSARTSEYFPFRWGNDAYMYCFEIYVISDAGASGDFKLSDMLKTKYGEQKAEKLMKSIAGSVLYWVDYEPGDLTPTTASQITIDKETTALIFDETVTVAGTAESWRGDTDTSKYAPITDIILAMSTLTNTKTATIKLWFLGGNQ